MPNGEAVDMEFDGVQLRWGTDSWPCASRALQSRTATDCPDECWHSSRV
jgi:hypothetical protein